MKEVNRYRQAKKVTLLSAIINIMLGLVKIIAGSFYHSQALIADGMHSLSDLVTDSMVLIASKYGSQAADDSHPYGHQRIETAATLLLALLLILAGIGIAWEAVRQLLSSNPNSLDWQALPIALLSVVVNEIFFHYTLFIGKHINSALIIANAWHHRSDAASSLIVALGLGGSLIGFSFLDSIAALIVSSMIVKMGINYGWDSVKELVDTAVDEEMLGKIETIIRQVDGVKKIHQLRSRSMGGNILIDVHILVSARISVSEGHYIAQAVHHTLLKELKIKDVTVHVDPEDDEFDSPSQSLPGRKELENSLLHHWQKLFPAIDNWLIHYLHGNIEIILIIKHPNFMPELVAHVKAAIPAYPFIRTVRLYSASEIIINETTQNCKNLLPENTC